MKYRKGVINIGFVVAIFLAIVFLIFLSGGGVSTVFNISKFLKSIPPIMWVILGVIILFKYIGGSK